MDCFLEAGKELDTLINFRSYQSQAFQRHLRNSVCLWMRLIGPNYQYVEQDKRIRNILLHNYAEHQMH